MGAAIGAHLAGADFVEHEYVAAGTASSYVAKGDQTVDGRWTFEANGSAAFRTRVLVRRPANASKFSGTVVVEWLNVSGGVDANPEYADLEDELLRSGDAWVGVSAQLIGVEGGSVLVTAPAGEGLVGKGLKAIDPARYASLAHPGDGFAFDIFTQVARALREGTPAMGDLKPERLLAAGDSQSAFALTTYYNGVQPLTRAFDGFLVHSRAAFALPLAEPGKAADLTSAFGTAPPLFRSDLDTPVLDVQSESDVIGLLNSVKARQPDTDRFRLWEVAGTAHADAHLLGPTAGALDCGAPINAGPMHVVLKAALRQLDTWVRTGATPPEAPRLEVTGGDAPQLRRDADGIALGGVRTPPVDVPIDVLSGLPGPNPSLLWRVARLDRAVAAGAPRAALSDARRVRGAIPRRDRCCDHIGVRAERRP